MPAGCVDWLFAHCRTLARTLVHGYCHVHCRKIRGGYLCHLGAPDLEVTPITSIAGFQLVAKHLHQPTAELMVYMTLL